MAAKTMKSSFMTGVHYLNHQQYTGESLGGMQMINRRLQFSKSLNSKDLYAHYGCVNAVEFSNDGEWLVSGGDDQRVLIWNVDKALSCSFQPKAMKGEHNSNIFCLGFNASHTKLFSAGNDEQVILHDVNTADILDVFLHDEAVYGLSVDPINESIFASACDDGRVLIWDIRQTSNDTCTLASCSSAYHAVVYNPVEPQYIATGNAKDGVCLWDVRKPRDAVMKYGPSKGAMSVRFNSSGTHILALRRRLPPVLYDVTSGHSVAEFDHPEYYNSCTMKSCCFAGDRDQYVLSGSDDFKLYVWKVPDNLNVKKRVWVSKAHFVLRGHRSIVNQVRYNNSYGILASSGVEKIVKLWSSFSLSHNEAINGYITRKDLSRKVYTHEEYINLVLESGQFMTHDYSHHSVQEDPRMMAFFDSLVQRDIEGWTSDSVDASDILTCFEVQTSDSSNSSSSSLSSESEDDQPPPMDELVASGNILNIPQRKARALQPVRLSFSETKEKLADKSATKENDDASIDRISQLIAEKRREAKLKTARATMSHSDFKIMKKTLKELKKNGITDAKLDKKYKITLSHLRQNDTNSNQDAETNVASNSSAKDKRKLLRKKRAKLSKEAAFLDSSSSDSDSHSVENGSSNLKSESDCNSQNEDKKNTENNSDETLENSGGNASDVNNDASQKDNITVDAVLSRASSNGANENAIDVNNGSSQKDSTAVDTILPHSSTNGLNGNATNSDTLVCFTTKNGKHHKRNYRKRSAEEMDDD